MKVDVIIPTLCPGREFVSLLERLEEQSVELNRIIVMNTEKEGAPMPWDEPGFFSRHPKVTVKSVKKEGFDHGGTRNAGVSLSDAEIFICMTQDALPADRELVRCLTGALGQGERIAAAYARQLPKADCGRIERLPGWASKPISAPTYARRTAGTYSGGWAGFAVPRFSTRI